MLRKLFVVCALSVAAMPVASASSILYAIAVDTSSISGTAGSLDFDFNPGGGIAQLANVSILNFNSDGALSSPVLTGDVAGTLPGTVTFDNGSAFNDYFTGFTFGNTLMFDVALTGPALDAPNGTATAGSAFLFSMFSDAEGTIPTLTTDTTFGTAVTINVNLDGTTTVTNLSDQTTTEVAPEPATLWLLVAGGVLFFLRKRVVRS